VASLDELDTQILKYKRLIRESKDEAEKKDITLLLETAEKARAVKIAGLVLIYRVWFSVLRVFFYLFIVFVVSLDFISS
jgi:hypothetical protein